MKQKGFTLIELLVVIAIIALLASLIIVAINQARVKSRDAHRVTTVAQMNKALALYYDSNNAYPVGTYYSGWDNGPYTTSDHSCWCQSTSTQGAFKNSLVKSVMAKLPKDPIQTEGSGSFLFDGQGKGFLYVSDGQNYVLGTYLEGSGQLPPPSNATSTCMAAGNYQVSVGTLNPASCPTVGVPPQPPPPGNDPTPQFAIAPQVGMPANGNWHIRQDISQGNNPAWDGNFIVTNNGPAVPGPVNLIYYPYDDGAFLLNKTGTSNNFGANPVDYIIIAPNGMAAGASQPVYLQSLGWPIGNHWSIYIGPP